MVEARPSHLRPLTLRLLTGLAHAHTKKAAKVRQLREGFFH
ncbi:hypothetical protein N507_1078 [Lacticaseibacillus rhamnosus DSM 14870]|nr:hypothetical protein N507_1078 [Lacticaseibacillus rhamnosus DSM 14870]